MSRVTLTKTSNTNGQPVPKIQGSVRMMKTLSTLNRRTLRVYVKLPNDTKTNIVRDSPAADLRTNYAQKKLTSFLFTSA